MRKVMTIVGTRPELIKMSRVIAEFDRHTNHILVHTGQNFDFELNEVFFRDLGIRRPDHFLEAAGDTPAQTIARVIERADVILEEESPEALLIYGDTNSCLAVIAAKRRKVPVFHMEAGNRCYDQRVPEELNRKIVDHLSDVNLVLTEHARRYLLSEGLPADRIFKTGSHLEEVIAHHREAIGASDVLTRLSLRRHHYFLVSMHREENVDETESLLQLLKTIENLRSEYSFPVIVSTHPRTRKRLNALGVETIEGVRFLKPFGYFDYVRLQQDAFCVLSDSGTITEEASLLGFPAVTIRNTHERPEGMDEGTLIMCGLRSETVLDCVRATQRQAFLPRTVDDYRGGEVSKKVLRIVLSYIDYVQRTVWSRPS